MENKLDLKPQLPPLLATLPEYLKNPANYERVQKQILETILTSCSHSDVFEWAKCKICTVKMLARRRLLKKLGFKNASQYMGWRKAHEKIKQMYPLVSWNKDVIK